MEPKPDQFLPTRVSLLRRLKDWDDQASWQEFYSLYRQLLFGTALKAGLTEAEAEDVVQETMISVAKTIKDFQYDRNRCTFKSWLRHLTQKRIADQFRRRARDPGAKPAPVTSSHRTPVLERLPAPESLDLEAIWEDQWRQKLFAAALERVKAKVSPDQYQIFDFYILRKLPAKQVAATLEVGIAQVYLAGHRIGRLIKKEVKAIESKLG